MALWGRPTNTQSVPDSPIRLLDALPMQGDVQTLALLLLADAQPDGLFDDYQDHVTRDESVDDRRRHTLQLCEHRTVHSADFLAHEHAREQRADDAADAVHAESVQRIVVAQHLLERSCRNETQDSRGDPDDHSRGRPD